MGRFLRICLNPLFVVSRVCLIIADKLCILPLISTERFMPLRPADALLSVYAFAGAFITVILLTALRWYYFGVVSALIFFAIAAIVSFFVLAIMLRIYFELLLRNYNRSKNTEK